jgi:hypothetical protein
LFTKNSFSQAKQSIPQITETLHGDCTKMCELFAPQIWRQKNWMWHHENSLPYTSLSSREFFTKSNTNIKPLTLLSSVSLIGGLHFDTIELIEAESQAALNTLTENDFQDAFIQWQKRWEWCIRVEGSTSRVMVTSKPKISFRPDGSISLENYVSIGVTVC